MARRVILSDDLTGNESEDVVTRVYAHNGAFLEIDLSNESWAKFEKALKPFLEKSRPISRLTFSANFVAPDGTAPAESEIGQIREWARAKGMEVGEKGRLSKEIIDAYRADQNSAPESADESAPANS